MVGHALIEGKRRGAKYRRRDDVRRRRHGRGRPVRGRVNIKASGWPPRIPWRRSPPFAGRNLLRLRGSSARSRSSPSGRSSLSRALRSRRSPGGSAASPGSSSCMAGPRTPTGGAFIAPFFARARRVVAPTFTGMGRSDWRVAYDFRQFVREAREAGRARGRIRGRTTHSRRALFRRAHRGRARP